MIFHNGQQILLLVLLQVVHLDVQFQQVLWQFQYMLRLFLFVFSEVHLGFVLILFLFSEVQSVDFRFLFVGFQFLSVDFKLFDFPTTIPDSVFQ